MPTERGPNDFAEVARERGDFDRLPDGYIERHRRPHANWPALIGVAIAVITVIINLGAIAWYGGRFEQRQINSDATNDRQDRDHQALLVSIRELTNENNRQAQMIAGNTVAYQDIIRRLESIDRTMSSIGERRR